MQVKAFRTNGTLANNAYVLVEGDRALVIDPSSAGKEIAAFLKDGKLKPVAILITHGHWDHVGEAAMLKHAFGIPVYLRSPDRVLIESDHFASRLPVPKGLVTYFDDAPVLDPFRVKAISAPGHSPGSTIFQVGNHWFTGDALFETQVGADTFLGGSPKDTAKTAKMVMRADDELIVMPGHDNYGMRLGDVKKNNPELIEEASK